MIEDREGVRVVEKTFSWTEPLINIPKLGTKSGTTKVQLGADRAVGANGADGGTRKFLKKIEKCPQTAKNNVSLMSPPFGTKNL